MDSLTLFGFATVSLMLLCYALEDRSPWYIVGFAVACALSGVYAVLQGAWPFGSGGCLHHRRAQALPAAPQDGLGVRPREAAQHVVQDAAVAEIVELIEGVDRGPERHGVLLAV